MKKRGYIVLFMIALVAIGLIGYASLGFGAHPGVPGSSNDGTPGNNAHPTTGAITLLDVDGAAVSGTAPYSPKQTCGVCHNYESDTAVATKNHGTGLPTYQVPYPQHGVSAGYHFQQGRNLDWGDTQRHFFHQAEFTSSGGMMGKY